MKNIITFSIDLNVNIYISMGNTAEKKLFNYAIKAIKYYLPVKSPKIAKSILFWLAELSLFVKLSINLNCTKKKVIIRMVISAIE